MQNTNAETGKDIFDQAIKDMAVIGGFSSHVSMVAAGHGTTEQGALASMVHAKMCAHAHSIAAICKSAMFDHSAIMSLARMLMEGMTMYHYLSEEITSDELDLRYLILLLHDTSSRIMLMRTRQEKYEYNDLIDGRAELVAKIEANPFYQSKSVDKKKKLLTGEVIFIDGMRAAALRAGNWNEKVFSGFYSYLSAHAHSAPMSFIRSHKFKIDYLAPSDYQYGTASFAIEIGSACLRRVSLWHLDRHLAEYPDSANEFSEDFLKHIRTDDAESDVFNKAAP